jgi:glycosyltransferase involved in cell wall biosynthesis
MSTRSQGSPVRVLELTKGLGPGGAERLLLTMAGRTEPARVELHAAYLLPWKGHLVPELEAAGMQVTCLSSAHLADLRWLVRLRRLVRRERIEIVHVHSPLAAALARIALRLPPGHRPVMVGTEHNVWSSHHVLTRWANRLTLPLEDVTLAVSEEVRDSMAPRRRERARVVVHGADVAAIDRRRPERAAARAELGLGDDDFVIVTVANLRATKDYPTMLEAARRLVQRVPNARFLSVGQGPLADELAELRDELGLGDRFRFLGYQEDPIRVLVAGDVFCLSSTHEGLSIALIEAMAAGLPVVVTAVGGMPSVARDGGEGRVVAPGDPAGLADALASMSDPVTRRRCGDQAARRARDFDGQSAVDLHQDLYESLARDRR